MIKNLVGLTQKIAKRNSNLLVSIVVFVVATSTAYSQAPTVNTPAVTGITTTDATLGGTVTGTLTHRGTRWSTTSPVGTSNELEEASTTAGAFTQARTALPSAARIFFVAYARNNADAGTSAETVFVTEPLQLTGGQLTATANGSTTINLTFPAANTWAGTGATAGYVIYRNAGSAPPLGALADGAAPPVDGTGDKIATITDGTATGFSDSGLTSGTNYFYTIVPFAWDGSAATTYNFNLAAPQTANDFTFATEPSGHATGTLTANAVSSSQINLSFNSVTTSGITNATGYIVLIKSSAIVAADLATLTDGAAPNAFGLFEAIINSTSDNSYNDIAGLSPNTTYHYAIILYNRGSDDQTYNFLTTTGFPTGSATTPDITAQFTPISAGTSPVLLPTVLEAGSTSRVVLGFSVISTGSQEISNLNFSYTGLTSQITNEYIYYAGTTAGTIGSQILNDNSPDGSFSFGSVAAGNKTIDTTPRYYYLVLDVSDNVIASTTGISVQLTQAGVVLASGTVSAFSTNRSFTFNTSQLSDIILVPGGTTTPLNYIDYVDPTIDDDQSNSVSLADYQIRDGGAGNDTDNKGMSITSIEIQVTNAGNLSSIALFDDDANTEIAGTEQTVTGTGTLNFTFTPTTPISITDNDDFNLNVRGVFKETVTDNQSIQISIINVTATTAGLSGFSPIGTWASTQTSIAANTINVVATQLEFEQNPPATPVNTDFSATLKAIDANDNIDLNYTGKVDLTIPGGPATLTGGAQSLSPNLVAGQFTWTQLRINQAGTYSLRGRDDAYTGNPLNQPNLGNATSSVTITSTPSNITVPSTLNLCYGGDPQTLGNIVITETEQAGFSSSGNFTLALPTGFVFDQTVTTAPSSTGAGITISTLTYPSSSVVEFTITLVAAAATSTNSITIGGLRIRHPHLGTQSPAATGGTINRAGGTATIAGVISGTTLGNVNATETGPAVDFTVVKINSGDVDVEASETRFSQNSNPVRLVGSPAGGGTGTEFSGSGVTLVGVQYRFNPQSLSPGTYPITFKYKDAAGAKCEKVVIKNFEVYTTNITNLNAQYCNNDPQTLPMNVDAYLAAFYPTYTLDKFVYWDPTTFAEVDITNPMNDVFDPKLPEYQELYSNTGTYYGVIGIWIGFVISEPPLKLIKRTIWQLIPVRPAPKPSFALPGDDYEFCDDEAPVRLTGSPANSNSTSNDLFTAGNGQSTSIPIPSASPAEWFFIPSNVTGVTVGTTTEIPVTYTFRDPSTGCTGTSDPKIIKVNKRPEVILANDIISEGGSNPQICQGEDIPVFVANPDPNITYYWYNNITLTELLASGPSFQPAIDKNLPGITNFYVTKASAGCESAGANISVAVRNLPKIDFIWQNVCLDQTAGFSTTNFNAIENSTPTLTGLVYTWDFNLNNTLTHNNDALEYEEILISNPVVNYTTAGSDIVKLIVNTPFDCRDTVSKPVYIVPKVTDPIAVSTPYTQDFNTDAAGWIAGGTNSSWEWGTFLKKGTEANPTRGRGWETTLNGDNNQEEQSWVLSNCFDIASTKPVISLDIFSDTPLGVNGVVLQANTNGNIANDASWITIGAVNSGINWYDATGIASRPGNQASVGLGWSGNALTRPNKYETWTTAIFNLDPLAGASNVVFRLAFAADKAQSDGFAFDNVFIGERTRVVMMENFTNNSVTGTPTVSFHNNLYKNLGVAGSEVVKVQYHTPFPGDDPINALNPQINNARTAFYGITEAPTIRIDGRARTGNVDTWLNSLYDERVLTPSPIEIIPTVTKVNGEVIISTEIINRTGQTLPLQGAHVFTTIVQKSVTDAALLSGTTNNEFVFVARQMLPSPTGVIIESSIAAGDTYTVPDVVWRFNSGDAIVITVQETGGSKEVYQSHVVLAPLLPDLVTGIEDLAEYINIYPNPANESFEIELPTKAENRLMVNLIDPVGRATQQLYFEKGEQTKTVNTQNLAQGIYVVQIGSGKTGVVRKKVMIVH